MFMSPRVSQARATSAAFMPAAVASFLDSCVNTNSAMRADSFARPNRHAATAIASRSSVSSGPSSLARVKPA
jgi:hypothetical protein